MGTEHRLYVIWSNEHCRWWRAGSMGYASMISQAGRYSFYAAKEICDNANRFLPEGSEPNEVMLFAPECVRSE